MRAMRCGRRAHQHAPHPQAIRYRPAWEATKGALGEDHGGTVEKEVARLPGLPRADTRRALRRASTLKCPLESRVRSKPQARLCVQERLVCSAGVSPAGVTIGSPVAGRAGRRETDGPEAPRQPHPRDEGELSGRNASEREVAPKVSSPGGRACNCEAKAARPVASRSRWRVAPAGWLATARRPGHIEQLEKPSSSRCETGGSWVGPITGSTGKWADDGRVTDGSVVARKRGNARGAKGPCCSACPPPTREAGVR